MTFWVLCPRYICTRVMYVPEHVIHTRACHTYPSLSYIPEPVMHTQACLLPTGWYHMCVYPRYGCYLREVCKPLCVIPFGGKSSPLDKIDTKFLTPSTYTLLIRFVTEAWECRPRVRMTAGVV
ncbi:hypothetical protein EJ02DRAFT_120221 [Clathrospora elynae]|uniref:Uncharacterized protein n=1 Tax=Clathrospora elynae TaxID=706981 RepID=A0A6A5SDR7_9PLEO|nr:hypothetical protein EJ02DRAFT_120221 [Clathrospora elynae]